MCKLRHGYFRNYQNATSATFASVELEGKVTPPRGRHHTDTAPFDARCVGWKRRRFKCGEERRAKFRFRLTQTPPQAAPPPLRVVR